MGRLVLTRFNRLTWKAEQLTIDNVELEAQYVDDFGRYTTIIKLKRDNPNCLQKSYVITEVVDQRLVEGIHYNQAEAVKTRVKKGKLII